MKWSIVVLIVGLAMPTITFGTPVQWTTESGGNGHWYEAVLVLNGITWPDANVAAIAAGGYLVAITSESENQFAYSLVSDNDDFWFIGPNGNGKGPWLGGLRVPDEGWQWGTGEAFAYTNWAAGQPDDAFGIENNIQFFQYQSLIGSSWNDYAGEIPADNWMGYRRPHGYIVEYNSVPEPSALFALCFGATVFGGLRLRRSL